MASASIISIAAGSTPRADDGRNRRPARVGACERGEQGANRLRQAGEPDDDLGDDAERALRADERAEQVVSRRRAGTVADPDKRPRRQSDLKAEDVVHGEAVLEAVRAARVLRHVPADRADHLARRVGGVEVAERLRCLAHGQIGDAGFDHGARFAASTSMTRRIFAVTMRTPSAAGQRAAGKTGPRAARHVRQAARPCRRGRSRPPARRSRAARRSPGCSGGGEAVAFVGAELARIGDDVRAADDLGKPRRERRGIAILTHASTLAPEAPGRYPQNPVHPFQPLDSLRRSAVRRQPPGRAGS